MRKSTLFLLFVGCELLLAVAAVTHAAARRAAAAQAGARVRQVVRHLGLTDLALFTEARYTRHLTQADLSSAYQDHPVSLEHFPSGSLVPRPLTGLPGTK